jgi:hypothetical protein
MVKINKFNKYVNEKNYFYNTNKNKKFLGERRGKKK